MEEKTGVLRLLLQPWESREVAVVFTPSEHKPTTTILIIRYSLIIVLMDLIVFSGCICAEFFVFHRHFTNPFSAIFVVPGLVQKYSGTCFVASF